MAMLLPLNIAIEVWLFQEPQWALPADPAADANTDTDTGDNLPATCPDDPADASALALLAAGLQADANAVFNGYCIVPKCFWRFEDNPFSLPWQQMLDDPVDHDREDEPEPRPRTDPGRP